jgi:hypothetical protein
MLARVSVPAFGCLQSERSLRAPFHPERKKELPGLQPNPEAVAWGKRQASRSPCWSDAKWNKIGIIFGVDLTAVAEPVEQDQTDETLRDAA